MKILLTGSTSQLGRALVGALAKNHDVRTLADQAPGAGPPPTFVGDPRDRDFAAAAVQGCDAVIHLAQDVADGRVQSAAPPIEVLDAAARGTYNLLTTASAATRFLLISTLRIFERYPYEDGVNEWWAPRPTTEIADLAPYLAEVTVRELARVLPIRAIALRLGEVVDDEQTRGRVADCHWLHLDDAVQGVLRALQFEPAEDESSTGWWVFHLVDGGRRARFPLGLARYSQFGYQPRHRLTDDAPPPAPVTYEPRRLTRKVGGAARKVVIFGAGGPLGAATTEALTHDHVLRVTDLRPLADITAENKPQSPGAPLPHPLDPPHEVRIVDISDPEQVLAATQDMDAIINCTVTRRHPITDFRVNMIGAYNVMRAAVAGGIRRVVHTGPGQVTHPFPASYWYEFGVSADVPQRPGKDLYGLTKFLGQEVCRIFAEEHDLEVPTLVFGHFNNPAYPANTPLGAWIWLVSWEDAAAAMRQALHAPSFPRPYEVFHISTDLPHGKYPNDKAKELLKWQPRDRFEHQWRRTFD